MANYHKAGLRHRGPRKQSDNTFGKHSDGEEDEPMLAFDNDNHSHDHDSEDNGQPSLCPALVNASEHRRIMALVQDFIVRAYAGLRDTLQLWFSSTATSTTRALPAADPSPAMLAALVSVESLQKTPFNDDLPHHEAELAEIWALLQPDKPFQRLSPQWGELGFQGKDPATDLRGQGILALRNMLYLARKHTAQCREMLLRPHNGFPFALAVINISSQVTLLAKNAHVGNALFESSTDALHVFDEFFALVFVEFERFYSQCIATFLSTGGNPAFAIMEFNAICKRYFDELATQINRGQFDDVFAGRLARNEAPLSSSSVTASKGDRDDVLLTL